MTVFYDNPQAPKRALYLEFDDTGYVLDLGQITKHEDGYAFRLQTLGKISAEHAHLGIFTINLRGGTQLVLKGPFERLYQLGAHIANAPDYSRFRLPGVYPIILPAFKSQVLPI